MPMTKLRYMHINRTPKPKDFHLHCMQLPPPERTEIPHHATAWPGDWPPILSQVGSGWLHRLTHHCSNLRHYIITGSRPISDQTAQTDFYNIDRDTCTFKAKDITIPCYDYW